jgi:hypothetical protein
MNPFLQVYGLPLPGSPFQTCEVHLLSSVPPAKDPVSGAHQHGFVQVLSTDSDATSERLPLRTEGKPLKPGLWFHVSRDTFTLRVCADRPYDERNTTRLPVETVVAHKEYIAEDYRRRKSALFFRGE